MRNPRKNLQIAIAFFVVAAAVAALTFRPDSEQILLQGWLGPAALAMAVAGFLWGLVAFPYARSFTRLQQGKGVLARWTISPAQWEEFVELSRRNFDPKKMWRNRLDLGRESPPSGVEVVVSDDAVLVGGNFHYMPFDAAVTIHGSWMEFDHFSAGGVRGGSHHVVVPLSDWARGGALRGRYRGATPGRLCGRVAEASAQLAHWPRHLSPRGRGASARVLVGHLKARRNDVLRRRDARAQVIGLTGALC